MPETIGQSCNPRTIGGVFATRDNADKAVEAFLHAGVSEGDIHVAGLTLGTAAGAGSGGATGTFVAGPVGTAVGAVAGAVVGGGLGSIIGKAREHRK